MTEQTKSNSNGVPIAIVIAGLIVAGAIFMTSSSTPSGPQPVSEWDEEITNTGEHVLGNADASITLTEYSDTECPFCKGFHQTMERVMTQYSDVVAWKYKHFPLDALHQYARSEAEAAECVAQIAGEDAYWEYLNTLIASPADSTRAKTVAQNMNIDQDLFASCTENDVFASMVEEQYQSAMALGVRGTPHTIISTDAGREFVINGAYPYDAVVLVIDMLLEDVADEGIDGFITMLREGASPEDMEALLQEFYPKALENVTIVE